MVFAVWAVRRDFAADHPGLVKDVHEAFLRSRDLCLAELDEVAAAAARWEPFDAATLASYFRVLDFSLGERQVAGLREFARRAAARGDVPALPADGPEFFASWLEPLGGAQLVADLLRRSWRRTCSPGSIGYRVITPIVQPSPIARQLTCHSLRGVAGRPSRS